ncbi:hypothetical protein DM75_2562 [Burkholderia mallei]|nr:hypothetical protein DM75_2562 [Burkholderia mallei]
MRPVACGPSRPDGSVRVGSANRTQLGPRASERRANRRLPPIRRALAATPPAIRRAPGGTRDWRAPPGPHHRYCAAPMNCENRSHQITTVVYASMSTSAASGATKSPNVFSSPTRRACGFAARNASFDATNPGTR